MSAACLTHACRGIAVWNSYFCGRCIRAMRPMTWLTCGRISAPFHDRWKRRTTHICTLPMGHREPCSWEPAPAAPATAEE